MAYHVSVGCVLQVVASEAGDVQDPLLSSASAPVPPVAPSPALPVAAHVNADHHDVPALIDAAAYLGATLSRDPPPAAPPQHDTSPLPASQDSDEDDVRHQGHLLCL